MKRTLMFVLMPVLIVFYGFTVVASILTPKPHPLDEIRDCYDRQPLLLWGLLIMPDKELKNFSADNKIIIDEPDREDFARCAQQLIRYAESQEDKDYLLGRLKRIF